MFPKKMYSLNLNLVDLVNARKQALMTIVNQLNQKFSGKPWSPSAIQKEINKLKTLRNQKFEPFCQYVVAYLERRLS